MKSALGAVCVFAYRIMGAQYSLYVAAVIFSAQLHSAAGLQTHQWFDLVRERVSKAGEDGKKGDVIPLCQ